MKDGAKAAVGGHKIAGSGYFVEPTILVDVRPEMKVVREEIFGPVVTAIPFSDPSEIVKSANDTRIMAWHRQCGPATSAPLTKWPPSCAPERSG